MPNDDTTLKDAINNAHDIGNKIQDVLDENKVFDCMMALCMVSKVGFKSVMAESLSEIVKQDDAPNRSMALLESSVSLNAALSDFMRKYAQLVFKDDYIKQVHSLVDKDVISDDDLTSGKHELDDLCNTLFNTKDNT